MNTSNQTYKELAIPHFKEVFDIIDGVMIKHETPYYLIGASAIALELLKSGVKPSRGTKDIDFAIMISSMTEYEKLSETLISVGFNKVKAPWTFYSEQYNVAIDILPFGEIEEHDTIQFNKRHSDLHVLGFKEVLENPGEVSIEDKIVNIPPLPGMVVLKLVSWSDRPEDRENDLTDILRIIEHYFEHNFDEMVQDYSDTFSEDNFDPLLIAAEVLGRKAKSYLEKSVRLSDRIVKVIEENLGDKRKSAIAKEWARAKDWDIEYSMTILQGFHRGIT